MSKVQRQAKTAPQRGATRQAPARGARRAAVQKTPGQWLKKIRTTVSFLALAGLTIALLLNAEQAGSC